VDADLIGAQLAGFSVRCSRSSITGSLIAIVREVLLYRRGAAPEPS
jgi:hypothetical protein